MDRSDVLGAGFAARLDGLELGSKPVFYGIVLTLFLLGTLLSFVLQTYLLKVMYLFFMFVSLAVAWNYLSGYTGYVSFGPVMFFGAGAYITTLLIVRLGIPWYGAVLPAGVLTGLLAVLVGLIILRITGTYFVIATLLLAEGFKRVVLVFQDIFGGSLGMTLTDLAFFSQRVASVVFVILAVASLIVTYETVTSTFGLRMIAIREDEDALSSLGVNPLKYKLSGFTVHAVLTALPGGMYALTLGFVYPETMFAIDITLTTILVAILGGMGTVWGAVVGGLVLIPMQEVLFLQFPSQHLVVFGLFLAGIIWLIPEGLVNKLADWGVIPSVGRGF